MIGREHRSAELSHELGALDRAHQREREAIEDEYDSLASRYAAEVPEDPLGVLGPVLQRLRGTHPDERLWAGPGWHRLIAELDARLAELSPDYQLVQVKEKFGGLRYYVQLPAEAADELWEQVRSCIRDAESASYWICEVCGRAGRTRGSSRIRTLCELHRRWGVHESREI